LAMLEGLPVISVARSVAQLRRSDLLASLTSARRLKS
jgi:hypothetical protein